METLSVLSLIHGFTVLIVHNTVSYSGDYLDLMEKMLEEKL
ncbi:MAG: hypothetical protein ACM3TR_05900 [Caulobacteraceae bacterium]